MRGKNGIRVKNGMVNYSAYCTQYSRIVSQLAASMRVHFPAIITKMYSCAIDVIVGLRGGHFTALHNRVMDEHIEEWMKN